MKPTRRRRSSGWNRPEAWPKVTDDDRAELAGRLAADFAGAPAAGKAMAEMRRLLVRRSQLPALERQLLEDLGGRVPKEIKDGPPSEATEVDISSLVPPVPLRTPDDLKAWLGTLEAQIGEILKRVGPVKLKIGP